jgi:hypothetical protein
VLGAFGPHPGVVEAGPDVSELGFGGRLAGASARTSMHLQHRLKAELDLEENGSWGGPLARRYGPMRMGEPDLGVVRVR